MYIPVVLMNIDDVLTFIAPVVIVCLGIWWYIRYRNRKNVAIEIMTRVNTILQPKAPEKMFIGLKDGWWH